MLKPTIHLRSATSLSSLANRGSWLLSEPHGGWHRRYTNQSCWNLVLAIFNMIPIPPLDGSRIALSLMPGVMAKPYAKLERFGFMILLGIIFLLPVLRQTARRRSERL